MILDFSFFLSICAVTVDNSTQLIRYVLCLKHKTCKSNQVYTNIFINYNS